MDFNDDVLFEYPDFPNQYLVYIWNISIEDRKNMTYLDTPDKCLCTRFGRCDAPKDLAENEVIEIIGDDLLQYDVYDEFVDSSIVTTVRCTSCGCTYRVNKEFGYRTTYYSWKQNY